MKRTRSRRRKHRRNSSKTPSWLVPAIVVSGLVSLYFWKQANPGQSLNPTPTGPAPV